MQRARVCTIIFLPYLFTRSDACGNKDHQAPKVVHEDKKAVVHEVKYAVYNVDWEIPHTGKETTDFIGDLHNKFREKKGITRMLKWNTDLAEFALEQAKLCPKFLPREVVHKDRPGFGTVGQNVYGASQKVVSFAFIIDDWMQQESVYNETTGECIYDIDYVCESYKQVMWEHSVDFGCASWLCPLSEKTTTDYDRITAVRYYCEYSPARDKGPAYYLAPLEISK